MMANHFYEIHVVCRFQKQPGYKVDQVEEK
jgi:hypothetical protein